MDQHYPDFFIVGAAKCGTTSLFNYLCQHPDVFCPQEKEPNYFATDLYPKNYISLKDYLSLYSMAGDKICGDASVSYLYSKSAASNIQKCCPHAKIIIMLRNPVDMMYSLHSELLFHNWENIESFEMALNAEESRKNGHNIPRNVYQPALLFYRERAKFYEQIMRYLDCFTSNQVHFIILDDLKADPAAIYMKTLEFLELDTSFTANFTIENPNKTGRNPLVNIIMSQPNWLLQTIRRLLPFKLRRQILKTAQRLNIKPVERVPMNTELRQRLHKELMPEIEKVENLLNRNLSLWTRI